MPGVRHANLAALPGGRAALGLLWVAAGVRFGMTAQAVCAIAFFYLLLLLAFIDLDTMRLPNPLVGLLARGRIVGAAFSQVTGVAAVPLVPLGAGPVDPLAVVFSVVGASSPREWRC